MENKIKITFKTIAFVVLTIALLASAYFTGTFFVGMAKEQAVIKQATEQNAQGIKTIVDFINQSIQAQKPVK